MMGRKQKMDGDGYDITSMFGRRYIRFRASEKRRIKRRLNKCYRQLLKVRLRLAT